MLILVAAHAYDDDAFAYDDDDGCIMLAFCFVL